MVVSKAVRQVLRAAFGRPFYFRGLLPAQRVV